MLITWAELTFPFVVILCSSQLCQFVSSKRQPNILLVFPDELRYDWGGLTNNPYYKSYDNLPINMPNFDQLAKSGVRFTRAVVATPVCAPSRACLAAGREYDAAGQGSNGQSSAHDEDFDIEKIPSFYQVLQQNGYWTMITGRDDLTKHTGPGLNGSYHTTMLGFNDSVRCAGSVDVTWGECRGEIANTPCSGAFANESSTHATIHEPHGVWLSKQQVKNETIRRKYNITNAFELKFKRYQELLSRGKYNSVAWYAIPDVLPLADNTYQDNWIGRQAISLLKRKPVGKPWFLEVSHQAPHPPMDITESMMASVSGRPLFPHPAYCNSTNSISRNALCTPKNIQITRRNYAAKIERVDYWLGQYLAVIKAIGGQADLDNTLICLTSDHGDMLADRGTTAKSKPWQSAMSVPLICSGPNIKSNTVIDTAVTTMDLAATFIDFSGGVIPSNMTSISLRPLMSGNSEHISPPRTVVHSGLSNFRTIIFNKNSTHTLKFFCCNGVCPGSTAKDRAATLSKSANDEIHLFNIAGNSWVKDGRFEHPEDDLAPNYPDLVRELAGFLPPKNMNRSFSWKGCDLTGWVGTFRGHVKGVLSHGTNGNG